MRDKNYKITDNFKFYEFWSNNFGKEKVAPPDTYYVFIEYLANQLQRVRDMLTRDYKKDVPILITSAYRTPEWNASKAVEGAANSKHLKGQAVDSRAIGIPLFIYYTYLVRYSELNHLGYYKANNFVHAGIENKIVVFKY